MIRKSRSILLTALLGAMFGLALIPSAVIPSAPLGTPVLHADENGSRTPPAGWREDAYRKLRSLKAGFALRKFEEVLGIPTFVSKPQGSSLLEQVYRGRDHWVQTISDAQGSVLRYVVTSCDEAFNPTFALPSETPVALNRSTFATALGGESDPNLHYFLSGATANSYFIEEFYGANPGYYMTYYAGSNDACPVYTESLAAKIGGNDALSIFGYEGPLSGAPAQVKEFRTKARVNTYGETAPHVEADRFKDFQVGVDRIKIRPINPEN